jgi:hypothetical protein
MLTFAEFVNQNKDKIRIAAKGNTTISKNDPWRNETEWDEMYKDLTKTK